MRPLGVPADGRQSVVSPFRTGDRRRGAGIPVTACRKGRFMPLTPPDLRPPTEPFAMRIAQP